MIEPGKTYLVMGLLDPDSLAYSIGHTIQAMGGRVVYTVQNDIVKRRFLDRSDSLTDNERTAIDFRYCDITIDDQVKTLFAEIGPLAGIVHSIAFANPRTLLGGIPHRRGGGYQALAPHQLHIPCHRPPSRRRPLP